MHLRFRSLKEDLECMFNNQKALQEEKSHFIVVNEDVSFQIDTNLITIKLDLVKKNHRHK